MQDTTDCPYTTHSFKILGKCYKKCPYFSSLSVKYMHNSQVSYKKIILLAIISHLTESLKAHSTIHQAQEYPSGHAYITSFKKSKKEFWEQPRAWRAAPLPSQPRRGLPGDPQSSGSKAPCARLLPSRIAPRQPEPPGRHSSPQLHELWATLPRLGLGLGSQASHPERSGFCIRSLLIPVYALLYLESWGNQIFNILNESTPS